MKMRILSIALLLCLVSCGKDEVLSNGEVNVKQSSIQRYGDIFEVFYDNGTVLYFSMRDDRDGELKVIVNPYGIYDYSGNIRIPSSLSYASKSFPVTEIEDEAFRGTDITALELPSCLDEIGFHSFMDCASLKSVRINATDGDSLYIGYSFKGCVALEKVYLPTNVESVSFGDSTFSATNLGSVTLDNIRTIGKGVFVECQKLTKAVFGEGLTGEFDISMFNVCHDFSTLVFKGAVPPDFTAHKISSIFAVLYFVGGGISDEGILGYETLDVYVPKGCIDAYSEPISYFLENNISSTTFIYHELD